MDEKKIRILIAKPGLDGHDRGARVLTLGLRDEGMEVIYTGLRQSPEQIAEAAMQEDVDIIGLSCLSGAHRALFPRVLEQLKQIGAADIPVIGGGIISAEDAAYLEEMGVREIFGPGASIADIAVYIRGMMKSGDA